jgi:hypothetical protein
MKVCVACKQEITRGDLCYASKKKDPETFVHCLCYLEAARRQEAKAEESAD